MNLYMFCNKYRQLIGCLHCLSDSIETIEFSIFGADPENMPEEAKTALNTVDESSTKFVEALDELIQIIDKFK